MKQKVSYNIPSSWSTSPYSPYRAIKLLNMLEAGLTQTHGRKLTIAEVAAYAGQSTSTMFDWLTWSALRQVECVIRLFEALPKRERKRIMNQICRSLPTIHSKRLAWSEAQVSSLELVLRKEQGLTFLQGDENARGFVFSALGHSAWRLTPPLNKVSGIDVRFPVEFVPVPGVIYLNQPLKPQMIREHTEGIWSSLPRSGGRLILLNGIWLTMPALHEEVKALAASNHLIVADALNLPATKAAQNACPTVHILTATNALKNRISVGIQAA